MGSRTGRAAGYCAGYPVPGFMNPYGGRLGGGFGWGRGRGLGFGRGARWGTYQGGLPLGVPAYGMFPYGPLPYTSEQEVEVLQNQAKILGDQLSEIQKRIADLERESAKKDK